MRSTTSHPPLVIRSWELSEMSNEEHNTSPIPGCQKLRVKWDEQWGAQHPTPHPTQPWSSGVESLVRWAMRSRTPHPPLVIRSWELSEMSNEEHNTPHPPYPTLVIRSWELSEMSNEEHNTPPPTLLNLGHQELKVKWDEQWGAGHTTATPPTLGHQELRLKWDELVHIRNRNIILQCWHTETPGVWLVGTCIY